VKNAAISLMNKIPNNELLENAVGEVTNFGIKGGFITQK
jgi:hypothetical protein